MWEGCGRDVGGRWEGCGRGVGGMWEGCGRDVGGMWEGCGRDGRDGRGHTPPTLRATSPNLGEELGGGVDKIACASNSSNWVGIDLRKLIRLIRLIRRYNITFSTPFPFGAIERKPLTG